MPDNPPRINGEKPLYVDISNYKNVKIGWHYDRKTKTFTEPPDPEPTPEPDPEMSDREILEAMALDMEYLVTLNELEGN